MHRIRQSLPYFRELGWEPVVVAVDEAYVESYSLDPFLIHTIPGDIEIHRIKAFETRYTKKVGLGSLSMRSYFQYKKKGDELLKERHFDLVYFSTTAFHVMALGPRWKRKFGVPFVIDMQDPWRSDFYLDKPKSERPPKFFISYRIDKYLEAKTVPHATGIISVSQGYCDTFLQRYPSLRPEQFRVIPFGASSYDFQVMEEYVKNVDKLLFKTDKINVLYIGRGGHDMKFALEIIFKAFAKGLREDPVLFSKLYFWFVGTSYAPAGQGQPTIKPIAERYNTGKYVTEITDRIPYFDTLFLLKKADMLLVPGSTDTMYTASKIYPYILAGKPMLSLFYKGSSVVKVVEDVHAGKIVTFDPVDQPADAYVDQCLSAFKDILQNGLKVSEPDTDAFGPYTAKVKTEQQVTFFNQILSSKA